MDTPVTVIVPIKLAAGRTEEELLAGSQTFQDKFAGLEPGLIRREMVRTGDGTYLDIVQFRSRRDADEIIAKEMQSPVCREFFALIEMEDSSSEITFHPSLATYIN